MTIPSNACVFDPGVTGGVRRPDAADVGSFALQDKAANPPPKTGTHLYGDMGNQWERLLRAFGAVIPSCRITVAYSAGAPFIENVMALGASVDATTFTVTDNGTGRVSIRWTATNLPAPVCRPSGLTLHSAGGTHTASAVLTLNATPGVHEVAVSTNLGSTGAAVDVPFTFDLN